MIVCRAVYLTVPLSANKDRVNGRQKIVYSFKSTDGEKKGDCWREFQRKKWVGYVLFASYQCIQIGASLGLPLATWFLKVTD